MNKLKKILNDPFLRILLLVMLVGIILRLWGIYPGFNPYHPDEGKGGYSSATYMFLNKTLDLPHYHYLALTPVTQLLFLTFFYVPAVFLKIFLSSPTLVFSQLDQLPNLINAYLGGGPKDIWLVYWSRFLTAMFSSVTVYLTYQVGKTLYSSRWIGLLAALLLAVNFQAVANGQLDIPDNYNTFYVMLAFLALLKLKAKPRIKWYVLSGIALAFAISTKIQVFIFLPFFLIQLTFFLQEKSMQQKILSFFSLKILLFILAFELAFVIINIGPLRHFEELSATMLKQSLRYELGNNALTLQSLSYLTNISLTPIVTFLSVLGIVVGLIKYRFPTLLLLSLLLPYLYYLFYLTKIWLYPRFFLAVIPIFVLFAAVGLYNVKLLISKFIRLSKVQSLSFMLLILGVLYIPLRNSLIHDFYYTKPWSLTNMRNCLKVKTPNEATIASHSWDKHILFSQSGIIDEKKLDFIPLDLEQNYSAAELREKQADFTLIGLDVLGYDNSYWWMDGKGLGFWDKPIEISKNTFGSLAVLELLRNSLCAEVKPWQAVDNNYIFARVPREIEFAGSELRFFGFDSQEDSLLWNIIDGHRGKASNLMWDKDTGFTEAGSLAIKSRHAPYPVIRWVSPPFPVITDKAYQGEAMVKVLKAINSKVYPGFLRLDFYDSKPTIFWEGTSSSATFLSSRYGGEEWKSMKVTAIAPLGVKWATLSFQSINPPISTNPELTKEPVELWLDDVIISEGDKTNDGVSQSDEFLFKIDDNVLVPNLGGGF